MRGEKRCGATWDDKARIAWHRLGSLVLAGRLKLTLAPVAFTAMPDAC
jgi:hypothetical protein